MKPKSIAFLFFSLTACTNSPRQDTFDYAATKSEILEIDSIMREARAGKQNPKLYREFCEDSVVCTYDKMILESADALVRDLLGGSVTPRTEIKFHLFGTTAVLSYLERAIEIINKDTVFHPIRVTKTFAHHDQKWKMAAVNISPQHENHFKPLAHQPVPSAEYAGGYQWSPANGMPSVIDSVFVRNNKLFFKSPDEDAIPMFAVDDSTYMVNDDLVRVVFPKKASNKITHLTFVIYDGQRINLPKLTH